MKKAFVYYIFAFVLLGCSSNDEEFSIELVQKRLLQKQQDYQNDQYKICKEKAILDANIKLDSIIAHELNLSLLDSIRFPLKPQKPNHPGQIKLDDTTKVVKIIE